MKTSRYIRLGLLIFLLGAFLGGCAPRWEIQVTLDGREAAVLNREAWASYQTFAQPEGVPLEHILYASGARVLESVEIVGSGGRKKTWVWQEIAGSTWLRRDGTLQINQVELQPDSIQVVSSPVLDQVEGELIDIAPTAAAALGIPAPDIALGQILREGRADQVLLLFLDGFGYLRFQEAEAAGLVPVLSGLDPPLLGITTYPPITTVSTASLLTGAPPPIHGVETRGIRKTEGETLLDAAAAAGLEAAAVEGEALAFQLRGASFQLSGDRDGDGGTDDNVLSNALEVLSGGMPDLLLVHFHGIDDLGHQFGPGAPEEQAKIREIDRAVGDILNALPPETLVMIFADHGMHHEVGSDRVGNHRHLIERDMVIPIWIINVP
jgi:hypothetical protein